MKGIAESVEESMRRHGVAAGSTVACGVSGGADSTALLMALSSLREPLGITVVACHIDHGIRDPGAREEDAALVAATCNRLGIPLVVKTIPAGSCAARAAASHRSLEETARDLRHGLLREAARQAGACVIALAHTEDDVIETLLMRLLQGSDLSGLTGIPEQRGTFIRPMLSCSRAMVIEYLEGLGQPWREDETNADVAYLRNRVRHLLVPVLSKSFPGSRKGLLALSRKLGLAAEAMKEDAARLPWKEAPGGYVIPLAAFEPASPAVRAQSLLSLYDRFKPESGPRRLPWRFIAPALEIPLPDRKRILAGHGITLERGKSSLFWGIHIASRGKKGYFIEVSDAGPVVIQGAGRCLSIGSRREEAATGGISILSSGVEPPLILRSKRKGDSILLESGQASVKELLAGGATSDTERQGACLLADRKGVVAVFCGAPGRKAWIRAGAQARTGDVAHRMVVRMQWDQEEGREQQQ